MVPSSAMRHTNVTQWPYKTCIMRLPRAMPVTPGGPVPSRLCILGLPYCLADREARCDQSAQHHALACARCCGRAVVGECRARRSPREGRRAAGRCACHGVGVRSHNGANERVRQRCVECAAHMALQHCGSNVREGAPSSAALPCAASGRCCRTASDETPRRARRGNAQDVYLSARVIGGADGGSVGLARAQRLSGSAHPKRQLGACMLPPCAPTLPCASAGCSGRRQRVRCSPVAGGCPGQRIG